MIPPELGAKNRRGQPQWDSARFVLPERENYLVITDSDAHALETMSMHTACTMELPERSVEAVLDCLRKGVG